MFRSRQEAAERLAARLDPYRGRNPLVLAVPRGGVPMGRIIADALGGELDVVLVHKLGAPHNPEFAIGSVDEEGEVKESDAVALYGIGPAYVGQEAQRQLARLRERRQRYGRPRADAQGRIAIVVDDGVATGATLLAALAAVRAQRPARLVAAVGVAPPDTVARLEAAVDELVCLESPSAFFAVGQFFAHFPQVSDEEVIALLGAKAPPT